MTDRDCSNCCFAEKCRIENGCDDYYPANDDGYAVPEILESERMEYYNAWIQYISEYN